MYTQSSTKRTSSLSAYMNSSVRFFTLKTVGTVNNPQPVLADRRPSCIGHCVDAAGLEDLCKGCLAEWVKWEQERT